ncbi:tripartite tricarboxylate transporter substrate binding protein [soil metagenome]
MAVWLLLIAPVAALADDWPSQPIKLVVPFAAGGVTDIVARLLGKSLSEALNTPVVVENVAGANGGIGASQVARSKPDGYTLLMGTPGALAANMVLMKQPQYDVDKDFAPVATVVTLPNVLIVRVDLGVDSVAQLIDRLRKEPNKLSFGVNGIGANGHLTTELFKARTKTEALAVPYKGAAPMLMDLIAGQTDFTIDQATSASTYIRGNRVKVLAVASKERSPYFPDVPTLIESGVKDFDASSWLAIAVPKATPPAIVARLNSEINKALKSTALLESMPQFFATPAGGTPDDMQRLVKEETERVRFVAKYANIPIQ